MPFSDPLADGPVIQRAAERALAAGGNLREALAMIAGSVRVWRAPIVVFSYANPLLRMGVNVCGRAAAAGVDGVLALDLPIEEARSVSRMLAAAGLEIFLLSPTTTDARIEGGRAGKRISLRHLAAGRHRRARDRVATAPRRWSGSIRARTDCRIAIGFGCRGPSTSRKWRGTPTAVVGGAGVAHRRGGRLAGSVDRVEDYVGSVKERAARDAAKASTVRCL